MSDYFIALHFFVDIKKKKKKRAKVKYTLASSKIMLFEIFIVFTLGDWRVTGDLCP